MGLRALWVVRGGAALRPAATWTRPGFEATEFEATTRELVMGPGFGLPGAVWKSGLPPGSPDVLESDKFTRVARRARPACAARSRSRSAPRQRVVAVIELFAHEEREPDPDLLLLTDALGSQIGEFVEAETATGAVRQSEARKTAVLGSSLDAIITIDHTGHVVEFDRAAEQMFGRTAEETIGSSSLEAVVPPSLRERHREALKRFVATGKATSLGRRIELIGMRADGTQFPVELAINPIAGTSLRCSPARCATSRRSSRPGRAGAR